VFSFSWHKKSIFHFISARNTVFCEAPIKNELQKWKKFNFRKYHTIFYAQFSSSLHGKSCIATPQEIDKYLPIQLEAGQI
jgi:hypothetical protein